VLLASAKSGRNTEKLLDLAREAYREFSREIPTPELNAFFRRVVREYKPPTLRGRKISMGYMTQEATRPPTFAVLVNEASRVHFTYRRYLENRLREEYDFGGTSIVLRFRTRNPERVEAIAAKRDGWKPDARKPAEKKPAAGRGRATKPRPGKPVKGKLGVTKPRPVKPQRWKKEE
jgi:hypothetical protein